MIELLAVSACEEPADTKRRAVAIAQLLAEVPTEGEVLSGGMRRKREQQDDVGQVPLLMSQTFADLPVGTLERNVGCGAASPQRGGSPAIELVVAVAHAADGVAQRVDSVVVVCRKIGHGVTSAVGVVGVVVLGRG